jgi:N-acetyl-1-D-myo-inositol-2-amino-2-deoxy-alpha-D-glucopyranoside deacetylase
MQPTLLAVFAHPDDEAFGCGGTMAKYAAEGARVVLVCATRGEAGEISSPDLATPENLGEVRERELRCAADALGIADVLFLDYRDSGMAGTAENEDPRAFIQQPADHVVAQLVRIIREERPDAIITFEPHGGYGHPDHRAIHHATTAAISAAAAPTYQIESGEPWKTPRLLWSVIPQSVFTAMRDEMQKSGMDTSDFDQMAERMIGWPDDQVDLTMDVLAYADAKWNALLCHATQFGGNDMFKRADEAARQQMLGREFFVLGPSLPTEEQRLTSILPERVVL